MCTFSRHNNGRKPPTFSNHHVYTLKVGAQWEIGTPVYGFSLNAIQPTVIYDMTARYAKLMPISDYAKLQEAI